MNRARTGVTEVEVSGVRCQRRLAAEKRQADRESNFWLIPIGVGVGVAIGNENKLAQLDTDSDTDADTEI